MPANDDSPIGRIHKARAREIAVTFAGTPDQAFDRALELGAGDCFQGRLLRRFVRDLTCTDFSFELLDTRDPSIRYLQCDAEKVGEQFADERFDLVFSSNMIQHTPDKHAMLTGVNRVLSDDGVVVMIVPNCYWKIFKLLLFYALLLPRLMRKVLRLLPQGQSANDNRGNSGGAAKVQPPGNNPKFSVRRSRFLGMVVPVPLGAYRSNLSELFAFRRSSWVHLIQSAGFEMVSVLRGPFIIGEIPEMWNLFFSRVGLSTQTIYVAKKQGRAARYEALFVNPTRSGRAAEAAVRGLRESR